MKYVLPAIRFKIFMMILLGLIYPFAITGVSQGIFPKQASGDLISKNNQWIGSRNIAQKFEKHEYFWPRPSAIDYNPIPSGGSNLGQTSADLKKIFETRKAQLKTAHPDQIQEPPQDLLFASASGLDPHISPEAAQYQLERVAKARNLSSQELQKFIALASEGPQWGFLGEPTVNVLVLNLALDNASSSQVDKSK